MRTLPDLHLGLPQADWTDFYRTVDRKWAAAAAENRKERKGIKPTLDPSEYAGTYFEPGTGRSA